MVTKPEDVGLSSERLARVNAWAQRLVDDGKVAGMITVVARHGKVAHFNTCGLADIKRETRMAPDTIFRFYSMTKPLTSTAIMMLYEEGRFQLDDPITRYLPCFKDMRVFAGGMRGKLETVPAERDITFRDLLTHTSGLTYGFMEATPVDAQYRDRGVDFQMSDKTLAEVVEIAADIPLIAQPGARVELQHRDRRAGTSGRGDLGQAVRAVPARTRHRAAGHDRYRFPCAGGQAVALRGELYLHGGRAADADRRSAEKRLRHAAADLLRRRWVGVHRERLFAVLPDDAEQGRARRRAAARPQDGGADDDEPSARRHGGDGAAAVLRVARIGIGFGLGFSVMLDPAKAQILGTPGEYAWGGAASTAFWIDPAEDLAVIMLTQLMPSSTYPIRRELRVLTYQSVVD